MTPLGKLKLLTLDYIEFQRDRLGVLDQLTAIFGGEWGN
jgi:hypothetical protein